MKYAQQFNSEFLFGHEKDTIISDPKSKLPAGWLKFFYVARAGGEITVNTLQNAQSGLAVDGAEVGTRFRRPENGSLRRGAGSATRKAELTENAFVRDALAMAVAFESSSGWAGIVLSVY